MRRDLEKYLLDLEKQHQGMSKAVEEANELLKEGQLSQEQADQIQMYMDNIEVNYQRVLYCRYLCNLPPKFIQKLQNKKVQREMDKFKAEHSDKESVTGECQESLDGINEIVGIEEEVKDE